MTTGRTGRAGPTGRAGQGRIYLPVWSVLSVLSLASLQVSQGPPPPPQRWLGLIGEYGTGDSASLFVLEDGGRLHALFRPGIDRPLREIKPDLYQLPDTGLYAGQRLVFTRDARARVTSAVVGDLQFPRRAVGPEEGNVFRITPEKPLDQLYKEAIAATPPPQPDSLLLPDLVEVVTLDRTIKLDIRYATTRNFVSTAFYRQPRAFAQRPAAEALVRVNARLKAQGFGLLVHDSYRPWYVTRMFWDATPDSLRGFVANPANGSRHNRGCALDLTMYDRKTGKAVQMPSGYDEFSDRAYADYPGGTALQRWRRRVLRDAMEAEGFVVNPTEWWHFDYKDWRKYPVMNVRFEEVGKTAGRLDGQ